MREEFIKKNPLNAVPTIKKSNYLAKQNKEVLPGILSLVCKFLVVVSGTVLGILSGIIFLAALVLFFAS